VNLAANAEVIAFVKHHDAQNKLICPICSAAARVLGGNDLLDGRRYVCSGDLWQGVQNGEYVDAPVVEDRNLLSGKGLGTRLILRLLCRRACWAMKPRARSRRSYLLPLVICTPRCTLYRGQG
jgi:putative intracellular protease/amidase